MNNVIYVQEHYDFTTGKFHFEVFNFKYEVSEMALARFCAQKDAMRPVIWIRNEHLVDDKPTGNFYVEYANFTDWRTNKMPQGVLNEMFKEAGAENILSYVNDKDQQVSLLVKDATTANEMFTKIASCGFNCVAIKNGRVKATRNTMKAALNTPMVVSAEKTGKTFPVWYRDKDTIIHSKTFQNNMEAGVAFQKLKKAGYEPHMGIAPEQEHNVWYKVEDSIRSKTFATAEEAVDAFLKLKKANKEPHFGEAPCSVSKEEIPVEIDEDTKRFLAILDSNISALRMPKKILKILIDNNIKTVRELISCKDRISAIKGIGPKAMHIITMCMTNECLMFQS